MIIDHTNLDESHFINCTNTFPNTISHLLYALKQRTVSGHLAEFGVAGGGTITKMANEVEQTFYGFDTFTGLPEDWIRSKTLVSRKGKFSMHGNFPKVPENVKLIKGLFQDTLSDWLNEHLGPFSFIHIDSDMYSSAKYVLSTCNHRIISGTIIVFDELGVWDKKHDNNPQKNYAYWQEHEWKALKEWLKENNRTITPISRTGGPVAFAQAGIKVIT